MKRLLMVVLAINFLFEGFIAIVLIASPQTLVPSEQIEGLSWAINYGFAALAMASVTLWVWRFMDDFRVMGPALGILAVFHTGLTIGTGMSASTGAGFGPTIVHGLLGLACWFLLFQRSKWCEDQ